MRPLLLSSLLLVVGCSGQTEAQGARSASGGGRPQSAAATQERVAARIASESILRSAFGRLRTTRREDLTLPDLPLETRLAIPVSWNNSDELIQSTIDVIAIQLDVVEMMSTPEDIDRFIQLSAKYGADNSEVRASEIKNEISFNQLITPDRAAGVIRTEQMIRSKVGPKLNTVHARLATAVRTQLEGRPELLKPFLDERPPSDELRRSRAAVKSVLDEARKRSGR